MARTTTTRSSPARSSLRWKAYGERYAVAVQELRKVQEAAIGKTLDTPNLLDHPVLIAEVLENEDGEVMGGFFIESYPSIAIVGRSPEAFAEAEKYAPEVLHRLSACGFRIVQVEVPKGVPAKERKAMMKAANRIGKKSGFPFTRIPTSHGFFDLRGA